MLRTLAFIIAQFNHYFVHWWPNITLRCASMGRKRGRAISKKNILLNIIISEQHQQCNHQSDCNVYNSLCRQAQSLQFPFILNWFTQTNNYLLRPRDHLEKTAVVLSDIVHCLTKFGFTLSFYSIFKNIVIKIAGHCLATLHEEQMNLFHKICS